MELKQSFLHSKQNNGLLMIKAMRFSPIPIIGLTLFSTNDGIFTLLAFHVICLIGLPLLYCDKKSDIIPSMLEECKNIKKQILVGSAVGIIAMPFLVFLYHLYIELFGFYNVMVARYPLQFNWPYLIAFFIIFTVVNPILEELYWRFFLTRTLGQSEKTKLMNSLCYGLYHVVVLYYIVEDLTLVLPISLLIISYGRALQFIYDYFGLVAAMIAHLGADAGICAIVYDIAQYFVLQEFELF